MQTRWFSGLLSVPTQTRRSIATPVYQGPILLRGGCWGGITTGGGVGLDFGWVADSGGSGVASNGQGLILENNVALAVPRAYTPFNIHRMQNDASSLVEGFIETGGGDGPRNWRPLHFVMPGTSGRIVVAVFNNTGGTPVVGFDIEIVEAIPQAFLDCLKHLVM